MKCAYCEMDCEPTREHVIPDWYSDGTTPNGVFNARSPTKHRRGDILVKDVCQICNNKLLGALDAYGKHLYDIHFSLPVYFGETVQFQYDHDQLLRWLLKLCFNSGRVNNADVTILEKYRGYILGRTPNPGRPVVYANAITPTDFGRSPLGPAKSRGAAIEPPKIFRLCQIRPIEDQLIDVVQRLVIIDSYCFALFVPDPVNPKHEEQLNSIEEGFRRGWPDSEKLTEAGRVMLRGGDRHAFDTLLPHMAANPFRYSTNDQSLSSDPAFAGIMCDMVDGETSCILINICRDEIDTLDYSPTVERLNELVRSRDIALAAQQRLGLFVDGYDDDPRELWEISEVRLFLASVFEACPYLFFLAMPKAGLIQLLLSCCCQVTKDANGNWQHNINDLLKFLGQGFDGLNLLTHRHAISIETNQSISESVFEQLKSLFRLPPSIGAAEG